MELCIKPLNLHHYDVFLLEENKIKLWGNKEKRTYLGSAVISLDGNNVNLYCEDSRMQNYSELIGKQAYSYYSKKLC